MKLKQFIFDLGFYYQAEARFSEIFMLPETPHLFGSI